jgi:hypothetical protein
MKKIIDKLINHAINGVETYTHNGSTWLIFTESKQWVIELTKEKTLWYNYNFFKNIFNYVSMDVVDNQHYITKWVENNVINGIRDIDYMKFYPNALIKNVIEKGLQEPLRVQDLTEGEVDDIIQDGVKETSSNVMMFHSMKVEDTIQNGVKETITSEKRSRLTAENIIENGVKETHSVSKNLFWEIGDTLQNGVKDTQLHKGIRPSSVEHAIENGVKKTGPIQHKYMVEDIIENGELKTSSRNLEQFGQGYSLWKTETVINEGVKEIKGDSSQNPMGKVSEVIDNGVKETKTPSNGDIVSFAEWMKENNSTSYPKLIDDVIENGVKEIRPSGCVDPMTGIFYYRIQEQVDDVVDNGVKEIKTPNKDGDIKSTLEWMYKNNYQDDYNGSKMINNVIENGIKEVQPLPDQSGELIGYGNYYHGKEDRTKAFIDYLEETIKFGIKN